MRGNGAFRPSAREEELTRVIPNEVRDLHLILGRQGTASAVPQLRKNHCGFSR